MKKSIRKFKRIELVELVYQLRKDNVEQRKRCAELEKQLQKTEALLQKQMSRSGDEAVARIETMLAQLLEQKER